MRRNRRLLLAAVLAAPSLAAKPLQIFKVVAQWQGGGVQLNVWYTGDPPVGTVAIKTNWRLWGGGTATDAPLSRIETFTVTPGSPAIFINVPTGQLPVGCSQTAGCHWAVTFYPVEAPKPATFDTQPPPSPGWWILRPMSAAEIKSKKDPDLFLSGNYLASVGTKPIYAIQANFNYAKEIGSSGWFWGPKASLATAAVPKIDDPELTPRDKIEIDPDTITGSLAFRRTAPAGLNWLRLDLRPAAGEFNRKFSASNFVAAGYGEILLPSVNTESSPLYFNPEILFGFEGGHNLNTPDVLLKQPVDLSWYKGIARVIPGVRLTFGSYSGGKQRFQIEAKYLARRPLTDEPFVRYIRSQRDPAKPENVEIKPTIERTQRLRHLATVTGLLNFNDYWGFTVEYRYGSEPPLFRFVDHRVIVGLKFSAMFR